MLALLLAAAIADKACANPSIVSANVASVTVNGTLKHLTVAISVSNLGVVRQPSNLLQSLDVLQDDERVGRVGLQPLRPKQTQRVTYAFDRSADAGDGTTSLTFLLDFNGRSGKDVTCHGGNESTTISI
jgi:hypothetical protein